MTSHDSVIARAEAAIRRVHELKEACEELRATARSTRQSIQSAVISSILLTNDTPCSPELLGASPSGLAAVPVTQGRTDGTGGPMLPTLREPAALTCRGDDPSSAASHGDPVESRTSCSARPSHCPIVPVPGGSQARISEGLTPTSSRAASSTGTLGGCAPMQLADTSHGEGLLRVSTGGLSVCLADSEAVPSDATANGRACLPDVGPDGRSSPQGDCENPHLVDVSPTPPSAQVEHQEEGQHPVVEMVAELEWVQASALAQLCDLRREQLSLRLRQLSTQRLLLTTEACARTLRPALEDIVAQMMGTLSGTLGEVQDKLSALQGSDLIIARAVSEEAADTDVRANHVSDLCRRVLDLVRTSARLKGADASLLASLSCVELGSGSPLLGESCPICLSVFSVGDGLCLLECAHWYHHDCLLQWLRVKAECPLCKTSLGGDSASQ
eukprot:jgi/Botrbrau1/13813/Bobra.0056s0058.2